MRLAMPSLKIQGGFIRFYTARGVLEAGGGDNDVDRVSSFFFCDRFSSSSSERQQVVPCAGWERINQATCRGNVFQFFSSGPLQTVSSGASSFLIDSDLLPLGFSCDIPAVLRQRNADYRLSLRRRKAERQKERERMPPRRSKGKMRLRRISSGRQEKWGVTSDREGESRRGEN